MNKKNNHITIFSLVIGLITGSLFTDNIKQFNSVLAEGSPILMKTTVQGGQFHVDGDIVTAGFVIADSPTQNNHLTTKAYVDSAIVAGVNPTNLGITAGTTAGPIVTSSTGTNATLPTASATASGVVTTGNQTWAGTKTFNSTISGSITGNAGTVGGLSIHAGRNNEANKVVRTDGNGYMQAGWINTTSGDRGTTAPTRIYASNDEYIRYYTPANFATVMNSWLVRTSGDQTVAGIKTFSSPIVVATPTSDSHAATKAYVDSQSGGFSTCQTVTGTGIVACPAVTTITGGGCSSCLPPVSIYHAGVWFTCAGNQNQRYVYDSNPNNNEWICRCRTSCTYYNNYTGTWSTGWTEYANGTAYAICCQ